MSKAFWDHLKKKTSARIGLGRSGISLQTKDWLDFLLAHSEARFAVHSEINWEKIKAECKAEGIPYFHVASQARSLNDFLQRPDLGRQLDPKTLSCFPEVEPGSLSFLVSPGLSAIAVQKYALPLVRAFSALNAQLSETERFVLSPLCLIDRGRVALGDEIGHQLRSQITVMLIGERPGLSQNDSLGIYFTYFADGEVGGEVDEVGEVGADSNPYAQKSDADRNCLSNVRDGGLSIAMAAEKLLYLLLKSRSLGLSGVDLKDDMMSMVAKRASFSLS